MMKTESANLEYIGGVFKGLSAERQDYLLDTARSLLEVQDDNNYLVENKAVSHGKNTECAVTEPMSAYAVKKI